MRPVAAALLAGVALALGGCSLGGDEQPERSAKKERSVRPDGRTGPRKGPPVGHTSPRKAPAPAAEPEEARTIRAWNAALNANDYEKAASYFAAGAIVEQAMETRLRGRGDAIRFNRSLPCKSQVTDVDDEGRTTLAAFRLRPGRGGACRGGGTARVRFRVEQGKFKEWRQLDEEDVPPSQIAGTRPAAAPVA